TDGRTVGQSDDLPHRPHGGWDGGARDRTGRRAHRPGRLAHGRPRRGRRPLDRPGACGEEPDAGPAVTREATLIPGDGIGPEITEATSVMTRDGCTRICRYAFDYAKVQGRKRVTVVHKANILKATSGLFLETANIIAKEYEGVIACDDKIVDNAAMQLVINPTQF